jgi:hypothetical protein
MKQLSHIYVRSEDPLGKPKPAWRCLRQVSVAGSVEAVAVAPTSRTSQSC